LKEGVTKVENELSPEQRVRKLLADDYERLSAMRLETELKEKFLDRVLEGKYSMKHYDKNAPHFLVLRKWNSWYPSFFDTLGGCYVIVLPGGKKGAKSSKLQNVIVIDPGFRFLDSLRKYGIEASDVSAVIVTHFHPDHTAGLTEFLTLTQKLQHRCKLYLNDTSFNLFKDCHTGFTQIKRISEGDRICLGSFSRYINVGSRVKTKILERVYVEATRVFHREMGDSNQSLGLKILFEAHQKQPFSDRQRKDAAVKKETLERGTATLGVLGDTDGNVDYFSRYFEDFSDSDVLILHLGTISAKTVKEKYALGDKHLYDIGTILLLAEIADQKRERRKFKNLKSVVISEFGLEMANIYLLLQTMNLFTGPDEWQAFLNLFDRINEKTATKLRKEAGKKMFEFEKTVFSKLCLLYILRREGTLSSVFSTTVGWEQFELSVPILIGIEAFLLNPVAAQEYCSTYYQKAESWSKKQWLLLESFEQFKEAETKRSLASSFFLKNDSPFLLTLEKTIRPLLQCLVENSFVSNDEFVDSFQNFVLKVVRNILRSIIRGDISLYGFSEIRRISPFMNERFPEYKDAISKFSESCSTVLFCSCIFLLKALDIIRRVRFGTANRKSEEPEFSWHHKESLMTFDSFQDILQTTLDEVNVNVLIGDLGLDIVFDLMAGDECLQYEIKGRVVDKTGAEDYQPINLIRSEEIGDWNSIGKNSSNEKYLSSSN